MLCKLLNAQYLIEIYAVADQIVRVRCQIKFFQTLKSNFCNALSEYILKLKV